MATLRVSCPDCGDQEVTSGNVTVRVCSANSNGEYRFACPECKLMTVKEAEPRIVELLVSSGTRLEIWHLPDELTEAKEGDPINDQDLAEFVKLLDSGEWPRDFYTILRDLTPVVEEHREGITREDVSGTGPERIVSERNRGLIERIKDAIHYTRGERGRDGPGGDINKA